MQATTYLEATLSTSNRFSLTAIESPGQLDAPLGGNITLKETARLRPVAGPLTNFEHVI